MAQSSGKTLFTTAEAAEMLSISPKTLQMRRERRLPPSYVKIGGSVRYDIRDLEAFINSSRVEARV